MTQPPRGPRHRSRTAPAERTRRAEPTRFAAYTLLRAVDSGAYANLELPRILHRMRIRAGDAAFTTELAYGTLRHRALYDAAIEVAAGRPTSRIDGGVLDVLRLGAHQLLGMRVPVHAAADQTVGLARAACGAGAAGFVNAVMRRLSESDRDGWIERTRPEEDLAALALEHSHPDWIVRALRAALLTHGRTTPGCVDTELESLLRADNDAPRVSLVARPGLASTAELREAAEADASGISPIGVLLRRGDPGALTAVREGRAAAQDEGSQLVALALAAAPTEVAERAPGAQRSRWLDLCAGPGGKSGILATLASAAGADFTAIEVSDHRADLVRQTLRPAKGLAHSRGTGLDVRTADGRGIGEDEPAAYDRILVDAPCTGLGALRRRPEARWRRTPADLAELGPLQRDLLASALDAVTPGGVVGYATCSPHVAETTFVVKDVLRKRPDVELLDARPLFLGPDGRPLPDLGPGPTVQLWPHVHGTDGMFFALIRRRAGVAGVAGG